MFPNDLFHSGFLTEIVICIFCLVCYLSRFLAWAILIQNTCLYPICLTYIIILIFYTRKLPRLSLSGFPTKIVVFWYFSPSQLVLLAPPIAFCSLCCLVKGENCKACCYAAISVVILREGLLDLRIFASTLVSDTRSLCFFHSDAGTSSTCLSSNIRN
jgi:hypothetical protein